MYERYSIEANDESIMIYGDLSIEEAFDFLSFFERKGFNRLTLGSENSTLSLMRKSIKEVQDEVKKVEHEESEKYYENLYKNKCEQMQEVCKKKLELESLIKEIMTDKSDRVRHLEKANQELIKRLQLFKLENDEEIKKFTMGFAYRPPTPEENQEKIYTISGTDVMIDPESFKAFEVKENNNLSEQ